MSKAAADLLAYQYFKNYGVPILRARPFNHIGPRQETSFVCSNFAEQVALIEAGKMKPVVNVGNLKAKKDFSDVRDVVRAYRLILKRGKGGEAFNICRGEAYSIDSILRKLIRMSDKKIEIRPDKKRFRKVDIAEIFGDYSALKSRTGWSPKITMEESLKNILDYHRERLKSNI
jgi:GDP-4-dehydro-6-deoxy-D-mannose reductase